MPTLESLLAEIETSPGLFLTALNHWSNLTYTAPWTCNITVSAEGKATGIVSGGGSTAIEAVSDALNLAQSITLPDLSPAYPPGTYYAPFTKPLDLPEKIDLRELILSRLAPTPKINRRI